MKCPTCAFLLGDKELPYEEKLNIITNSNTSQEDKDQKKEKLLDDLGLKNRLCCRMRMISYVDQSRLII
tara:strand:- start:594 stop:800 length:207 start_codon:yes stop_codon:yes gene_type:complete